MIAVLKLAGGRTITKLLLLANFSLASNSLAAPWVQTTSLPDTYAAHTLTYASGYLYNIGGSSGSNGDLDGTNVFYAPVHSDGTIGTWSHATSLPEAVINHASVAANGFIYVLGGYHFNLTISPYDFATNIIYFSRINTNGTLGSWQTANPLPGNRIYLNAVAWDKTIYAIGGIDENSNFKSNIYSAQIQTDGSLTAWVSQAPIPVPNGLFSQESVANGYLYVLGGYINGGTAISSNVYFCKINNDGTLANWNATKALPKPLALFGTVTSGGRIFAIAGSDGGALVNVFYNGIVAGDGSITSWNVGTQVPLALQGPGGAASDSYIFISGGTSPINDSSSVYSMALPAPPTVPQFVSRSFTNGNFQLQLASTTNTGFGLQASTNLVSWINIGWGFTGTNGVLTLQDTNAASFPKRFYRAYWPLP